MSKFMFGTETSWKKPISAREARRRDRIAREIAGRAAGFVQIKEPNGQWKSWFWIPNLGEPFDRAIANEILEKCGLPRLTF